MSLILEKDFYGVKIPSKATVYGVQVNRVDIAEGGHRYDAKLTLKFFSEKTGEEIQGEAQEILVEGISDELKAVVLPSIYSAAQELIGGESDENISE